MTIPWNPTLHGAPQAPQHKAGLNFEAAWHAIQPIRGWLANKEQARFMWNACLNNKPAIEIGSYCGKSAVLMALAKQYADSTEKVYCIDTFQSSNEELDGTGTMDEFFGNVHLLSVSNYVCAIQADSHDPETSLRVPLGASIVYIDGGHTHEACLADIRNWRRHVALDGVMLFHDYYDDGQFPGIHSAIAQAQQERLIGKITRIKPDAAYSTRGRCCGNQWR